MLPNLGSIPATPARAVTSAKRPGRRRRNRSQVWEHVVGIGRLACPGGDVGEAAVAEVAVEDVALDAGDEDIGVAIVIEIADGDRRRVALPGDAGFGDFDNDGYPDI